MVDRYRDIQVDNSRGVQIGPGGHQQNTWQIVLNHRIAVLAVVVVAVLGAAAIWVAQLGRGADVELVAVAVGAPGSVDGVGFDTEGQGSASVPVTPIDITVKNDGAASAVVLEAQVTVVAADTLGDCAQSGGPLEVEANYDVRLPSDPTTVPFTVTHGMRFEVEPHASERFTLTVGPEREGAGSWEARVYVADVALTLDYSSEPLTVGRAAWVTMSGDGYDNVRAGLGGEPGCLARNSATMAKVAALGGVRSEEMSTVIKRYSHLTSSNGAVHQPTCSWRDDYDRSPGAVGYLCALYTKSVFVASVHPSGPGAARGRRLFVRLATLDGTPKYVVHCLLGGNGDRREQPMDAPGRRPTAIGSCSDYDPDYGTAWVFAYPSSELTEDTLVVSVQLIGAGEEPDIDAMPSSPAAVVGVERGS